MARNTATRTPPLSGDGGDITPSYLSKQEFGKRLYKLMIARGWNQSDLARAADLGRDAISTYVRGISFPDPKNREKLAQALGISSDELYPNQIHDALRHEQPSFEITSGHGMQGKVWLRINQAVDLETALKVGNLLREAS